jgi:hypothetical protein
LWGYGWPQKLAQAAKTFNYSGTEFAERFFKMISLFEYLGDLSASVAQSPNLSSLKYRIS